MRPLQSMALLAAVALAAPAEAKGHFRFTGPHPIAARYGGGYCYIEAPHLHIYPPDHPALYQQQGEDYVFTGDPTPFGYDGPRHTFYGPHPVPVAEGAPVVYCYIEGPHSHPFEPVGDGFKIKGDVAFYVGPFAPEYEQMRPRRAAAINAEYRPFVSFRPTVQVQPPPEWHGEVYVAPPAVVVGAPGVVVSGPQVGVSVQANIPVPGVYVGAPPPVVVGAPPRPGVVVRGPQPVYVAPAGPPGHMKEHHDNGLHKGWFKHGR